MSDVLPLEHSINRWLNAPNADVRTGYTARAITIIPSHTISVDAGTRNGM